jgi:hypothetical protein
LVRAQSQKSHHENRRRWVRKAFFSLWRPTYKRTQWMQLRIRPNHCTLYSIAPGEFRLEQRDKKLDIYSSRFMALER